MLFYFTFSEWQFGCNQVIPTPFYDHTWHYNNEMVQPRIDDSLDEARDRCFLRTVTHFWCATFLSADILRGFLEEKYRRFGSLSRDTIVLDSSWDDQVVVSSSSSF